MGLTSSQAGRFMTGCGRWPVAVLPLLDRWHIEHHALVTAWGPPPEVVVASK